MATCRECAYFFAVPPEADDYATGKGDCVNEIEDEKGKYWLSKPVTEDAVQCAVYRKRQ